MANANAKMRIRSGDEVIVVAGKEKGKVGRVVRVLPEKRQVVVEGVRVVRRHQKPQGERSGGILQKEMPLDVSNVALWDAEAGVRVKVGYKVDGDAGKVRINRKTGAVLEQK